MRILLVDDNKGFLAMLSDFLSEEGDHDIVGTAQSGADALLLIQTSLPHLVITDLSMPGTTGLTLVEQIKDQYPDLPTIILTLFDTSRHRQAAGRAGADALVSKEHMDTDLLPAIQQIASNSCQPPVP